MRRIIIILLILLGLSSCTKQDYCGIVSGGRSFITTTGVPIFILEVDGKDEHVDEKTYLSFFVGDVICLQF